MAVSAEKVFERFEDVEAATPIACDWPLHAKAECHVYYGLDYLEATQNDDYTVALNSPSYSTFIITPTTAFLVKINALIAADDDEANVIEVRTEVPVTNALTAASVRDSTNISRELDRIALWGQRLQELLSRVFRLPTNVSGYDLTLPEWEANKALTWHGTEKRFVNSTQNVNTDPTAQAVAAAAEAVAAEALATPAAATAVAAAATAVGAAASIIPLPAGGTIGQIVKKLSATDGDAEWQDPDASDTAAALFGATTDAVPDDADFVSGVLADESLAKWTWASIRSWLALHLAPTGQVTGFDLTSAPSGWIKRNGGSIGNASSGATTRANADTAALFAVYWGFHATDCPIQDSTGAASTRGANAAADFAADKRIVVPETRGEFMRGWDDGRGVDSGRRIGSVQTELVGPHTHPLAMDAVASHQHNMTRPVRNWNTGGDTVSSSGWDGGGFVVDSSHTFTSASAGGHTPTGSATVNAGAETRPRNSAVLVCVKL